MSAPVLECQPAAPPAAHPGIRGREAETAVLDDAIDRAAAGRLAVVLIDGEAGIGKTRLLQDVLDKARRAAIAELLAAGDRGDRGPVTVTSDPGLQFRAVDAFADLAEELALDGPLVLGADDSTGPARGRGVPAERRLGGLGVCGRVLQQAPEVLDVGPFGILGPDRDPHRPRAVQQRRGD